MFGFVKSGHIYIYIYIYIYNYIYVMMKPPFKASDSAIFWVIYIIILFYNYENIKLWYNYEMLLLIFHFEFQSHECYSLVGCVTVVDL